MCSLVQKYNVPGPRYTSYPTVPYWDMDNFSGRKWKETLKYSFGESNDKDGISLYIHLPFCESMCTFCGCHKRITKRHEVEDPYIKTVLKEWALYCNLLDAKPKIKELHLGGGTPTFFSSENLLLLIGGLFEHATKAEGSVFSFEGHPNNTTKKHLQTLYNVGFSKVSFGIQDYNEEVQKAIHRMQPFENVKNVTQWAREIGYDSIGHDLIFGLPFQKTKHIEETIAKTKELKPDRLAFYSYAHVPWLKGNGQRGYKDEDLPSAKEKREQYKIGKELLEQAGYHEIGMDHFALKKDKLFSSMKTKNLHRNFMGYTASKTQLMIGLGASSISDSWYSFAQNVKSLEEYHHLVEHNIIPIYRGHILTEEDIIIRKHILNIMCNFKTGWHKKEEWFPRIGEVLPRLKEMEKDGLLKISGTQLEVNDTGKPFVRNICMAFDVLLYEKQPEKRLFSMTI
ncbi:MAG: oxygen-independent coproporphyrinogen III oxidase [Flavobacteriaceae bacterium]|nr:MAG: oxygen-independent coproporphyrinogen III oxidase [Flavobacteriaceae bacterium]